MHSWIVLAGVVLAGAPCWAQTSTALAETSSSGNLVPYSTPVVRTGPPLLGVRSNFDHLPGSGPMVAGQLPYQRKFSGQVEAAFRGSGVLPLRVQSPGGLGAPRAMGARLPGRPRETSGRLERYTSLGTLPPRPGKFGRLP